ncbi:MAG: hypothetical protein H0T46_32745 [Deltaproteobacteria bacterium]|nr:hypothetical protein [Deltaproteobacteria bacterium]
MPRRLALLLLLVGACVDKGPGPQPKKIDPGFVGKHLLTAVPPLTATLDVNFGGKVVYLGNNVEQTRIIPGGTVKITHYWKVIESPGTAWKPFSLFRGDAGHADFMALPDTDMTIAHGPGTWRAGEIIEDPQEITLRPDWRSPHATLSVGLISPGAHGIDDRMAATGANVVDRAVIARVFDVDLSRAPPPPGTIHVPYARGPIAIDGVGADVGWGGAITSPELVTAEGSPEPVGKSIARMTWDDQFLYVFMTITDSDVFSEYKNHDDPLWKADCVELFIDADANKRGYVELQVNPNNARFDSWFPGPRAGKGDEAWSANMLTAVTMRGTADKGGDTDQGWDVEIAIPWAAVKGRDDAMAVTIPPRVGDRWKLNVVRVDKKTGDQNPSASSWNRITYSDFHGLDRMLTVVFADPNGGVAPGTPVGPAATGTGSGSDQDPGQGSGSAAGSGSATAGSAAGSGSATAEKPAQILIPALAINTATIAIDARGGFTINGAKVQDADLDTVLKGLTARDKQLELVITTEKGAPAASVVRATDAATKAGIAKIAVRPASP